MTATTKPTGQTGGNVFLNLFLRLSRRNKFLFIALVVGVVLTLVGLPGANSTLATMQTDANNAAAAYSAMMVPVPDAVEQVKSLVDQLAPADNSAVTTFNRTYDTWRSAWDTSPQVPATMFSALDTYKRNAHSFLTGNTAVPELAQSPEFLDAVRNLDIVLHFAATATRNYDTTVDAFNSYRVSPVSPWLAGMNFQPLTDPSSRALRLTNLILTQDALDALTAAVPSQ